MNETAKSCARRIYNPHFQTYLSGKTLDIGPGSDSLARWAYMFPGISSIDAIDIVPNSQTMHGVCHVGDAQKLDMIGNGVYDTVHSSHCLEHVRDPGEALANWSRVVKPGGCIVVVVPEADMYERCVFPSRWNGDHKWMFSTKHPSDGKMINLTTFLSSYSELQLLFLSVLEATYPWMLPRDIDHTLNPVTESAIEFVLRRAK